MKPLSELLLEFHTSLHPYMPGSGVRVALPKRLFMQLLCEVNDRATYSPTPQEIAEGRDWTKESSLPDSIDLHTPAGRLTVSLA